MRSESVIEWTQREANGGHAIRVDKWTLEQEFRSSAKVRVIRAHSVLHIRNALLRIADSFREFGTRRQRAGHPRCIGQPEDVDEKQAKVLVLEGTGA